MTADDELRRVLDAITLPTADEFAAMYEAALHPAPLPPGTPMCEAPGCRRPLPPPGHRGPRRRTCSNACRVRLWRAHRAILGGSSVSTLR